ncbi:MAG: hypothetical protein M1834_005177 [Cirrosporium novae-zelandiae]|nr:MAG: hypothetical protein M1834_005177 [Cirrosporium novae-zelandiae]
MLRLSSDPAFHFELLRALGAARYSGSDIAEILEAASHIIPGDFESWYSAFSSLADRVVAQVASTDPETDPISVRDAMFRAATYYRDADFYLHGKKDDVRIGELWKRQTACFDRAIGLLEVPGQRITVKAGGFEIPTIFYRAKDDKEPRPTIIMGNGFDGAMEEMLHVSGFAALERGYNVITYEGPGQPTVVREQGLGWISDWERVVTPVIDHYTSFPEIESSKIALLGYSLGGYLAARAAAFEHRLAGVILIDGAYDFYEAVANMMPPAALPILESGDEEKLSALLDEVRSKSTTMRWATDHGPWSFNVSSYNDFLSGLKGMSMKAGLAKKVECPVWTGDAEEDLFFKGQAKQLYDELEGDKTYIMMTTEEGAAEHCHVGAGVRMNQLCMGWFREKVVDKK